jgi:nucleoside-diphosphate-sugar epimerase
MTTLVVGCGYLGRRVAALLVGRGERVIGTTRDVGKADELAGIGAEPFVLDVLRFLAAELETPARSRAPRGNASPTLRVVRGGCRDGRGAAEEA